MSCPAAHRGQSSNRALPNELLLKLRQGSKEVKYEPASRGACVELFFDGDEVDTTFVQPVNDLE